MNTTVIAISDLHINSTLAVCPPIVQLDDEGEYHASRQQCAIWDCWLDFIERIDRIEGRRVLVINGDVGELDTLRRSNQLISTNKSTILDIIIDVLEPLCNIVDQVIVIRGTMAHTGKSAWLEEAVADDFTNTVRYSEKIASWWQMRKQIGNLRFDIAHHWSTGIVRGYAATRKAKQTIEDYYAMEAALPDVVLRGHMHHVEDSGKNYEPVHVWGLPCWTLKTEYIYRIGYENKMPQIGGLIFNCDGAYQPPECIIYKPKAAEVWSVL